MAFLRPRPNWLLADGSLLSTLPTVAGWNKELGGF